MARKNLNRGLGALAALGALSYHLSRNKDTNYAPVEDRSTMPTPEADAPQGVQIAFNNDSEPGGSTYRPAAARPPAGAAAPAAAPAARPARPAAAAVGLASPDADFPSAGRTRAAPAVPEGSPSYYDPRMANLSSAAVGRGEADAIRNAANAQTPLKDQLRRVTLGESTRPAPGAPSIYAGPEAWRLYNERKAAEAAAAATPPAPQGSARNIVQQMREKDKAVVAAVRRRQEQEAAAAAQNRAAAEQRRIDAELSLDPMERLSRGYKKGGAIKTKKMASGGMTSASKRGDGIASKGKTKCKMY